MRTGLPAALLCGLLLASAPAAAGLDVDLSAAVRIGDDTDLFFAISSRYFGRDHTVVQEWGARWAHPDDLAVALFLVGRTGRSQHEIFSLRRKGMSWWDISVRYGLSMDVWFIPIDWNPGPPYGRAYGHWKTHRHKDHRKHVVVLSDDDLRNLVAVRMIHEYYGVPVRAAMEWRASGKDLKALMTTEYRKRHGRAKKAAGHDEHQRAKSKGHGKKSK